MEKAKKNNKNKKDGKNTNLENKDDNLKLEKNQSEVLKISNKNSKIYLGYYTRYTIYLICVVICLLLFFISFTKGVKFKDNYQLDYQIKSDINYKVFLKDNEYYGEKYLDEGMQYITGLIDYIDLNFNYKIDANKKNDYDYKYDIQADVIITDRNNSEKVLYKDNYILKDEVVASSSATNNLNLLENLKIDYDKYNVLVNSFKSKYAISASSNLIITMHIEAIAKNNNVDKEITDKEDMKVIIPLSEQTINVLKEYNTAGKKGSISKYSYIKVVNKLYATCAFISLVASVISICSLFRYLKRVSRRDSLYVRRLNKIKREYDRVIVSISKMPDISKSSIVDVESFEELLDAKYNLDKPILHIEIHRNQKSFFLILADNYVYRYILKEADIDK